MKTQQKVQTEEKRKCTLIAQIGFRKFPFDLYQNREPQLNLRLPLSWPKTAEMGLGPLFPNADTINFDDEQLPAVMVHRGMHAQIRCQSGDEFRKNF